VRENFYFIYSAHGKQVKCHAASFYFISKYSVTLTLFPILGQDFTAHDKQLSVLGK
jgi:hypothetical protein